ncbi:MAG: EAL domain-containing protein [Clostridiales bacterium]|nr:EAL domain-containing protein [Clostridiales bacterium]
MKKKILIVDDQMINRSILKKLLCEQYEILEAANGEEALTLLQQNGQSISAVLLDIVMPVMDGYEVLRRMKADEELSQIPVIVASGNEGDAAENKEVLALSLGANDYVTKPYKPEIIKHRIANAIYTREFAAFINTVQHDALTGIYSKEYFYMRVEKLLKSTPELKYDIVCMDIERFKLINDLFGTQIGDAVLKHIANEIVNHVSEIGICGRIGADRFACLVPHRNEYKNEFFDRAIKEINQFDITITINVSYGIYVIEDLTVPVSAMCDRALLACNSIKGQYEKHFTYYDSALRQALLTEQSILDEMKTAIQEKQFEVYYQPKYDINSEKIAGAEALVRWNHPEKGFISPGEFIPLFEKNGFITTLDNYVWDIVCSDLHNWIAAGNKFVPVSVNVSRADIYNPNLTSIFLNLIRKYKLSPQYLHLEITETAYTENSGQLIKIVQKLKKIGFIIEMDDFGSGYSSLNMLSELPLDVLKLDMKFIQSETAKNSSKNILSFIISLAKWLNLLVIAEGVETKEQLNMLKNMDCNYVQGYYYAKPLSKAGFEKHLIEHQVSTDSEIPKLENIGSEDVTVTKSKTDRVMMIIDDVELNRAVLSEIFSDSYTIVEANNGLSAYEYIEKNSEKIDIILLDLVMPVMDGFKMLSKLKSNEAFRNIPVIVTSQVGEDSESQALEMGAADFISKPYNTDVALRRVDNVMATSKVLKLEEEKAIYNKMREMEKKVKTDALTGLYNRTELEAQVNSFFATGDNNKAVFIIMDIDNFKLVNDRLGHAKGDETIQKVAKILGTCFREDDVVCRMGGDEFSVFIRAELSQEELNTRMDRLCKKLRFMVEDMNISCSAGACSSPSFGSDYQTLYQNADMALLTAKRLGKNQYQIFGGAVELPSHVLFRNMDWLLDAASDSVMVCDANNYDVLYLNDVACKLANKGKKDCMGKKCYEALWNQSSPCSHCVHIDNLSKDYCEHEVNPQGADKSYIIKGKLVDWGGKPARIQYIQDNTAKAAIARQLSDISTDRKRILDMMPCGIFRYYAKEDTFDFVSENMLLMLGYSREEFREKFKNHFSEMVWHEDRERILGEIKNKMKDSDTDECEYRIEKANGELCWVHDRGHLVKDDHEKPMFYVTIMDITEGHMVGQKLMEEQKKLQIALEHSGMQYWEHDLITDTSVNGIKDANLGFADIIPNYSRFLIESGIVPEEYIPLYEKNQKALYEGAPYVCYDISLNNPQGRQQWWRIRSTNLFDESGKPVKTISTAESIDKLKEYEQRYEALVHESDVQTFVLDIEKHCITDNVGLSRKCGYDRTIENVPESLINSGNLHPDDIECYQSMYAKIYKGAKTAECISRWRVDKNGCWRTTKVRLTTVFDKYGKPIKAFGTSKMMEDN